MMKTSLRIFGVLLVVGGIIGTAYFSYVAFVEGNGGMATYPKRALEHNQEKVEALKQELQKSGNSKAVQANLEKEFEVALKQYQASLNIWAETEDFYKRQRLFATGSGATLIIGLLIFILNFRGPGTKAETVSP